MAMKATIEFMDVASGKFLAAKPTISYTTVEGLKRAFKKKSLLSVKALTMQFGEGARITAFVETGGVTVAKANFTLPKKQNPPMSL